jgi:transposase
MDRMENDTQVRRRRYGPELKARVVAECEAPGASVAKVAMVHGINANIVHGWRKLSREGNGTLQIGPSVEAGVAPPSPAPTFIPVALPPPSGGDGVTAPAIRIEFKRGGTTVSVTWPTSAASDCAAWLRELLR